MLSTFIHFYLQLWQHYLLSHLFRQEFIVDSEHCHYRRYTKRYSKKKGIVKFFWIGSGLITLAFPSPPLATSLLIGTTFLSFSFLDETE